MSSNIGFNVKRDPEYIAQDLIPYRNSKIEKGIEFPVYYMANINTNAEEVEHSLYKTFKESEIKLAPKPTGGSELLYEFGEIIDHLKEARTDLEAQPNDISVHAPVLQQGIDAIEDAGYYSRISIHNEVYGDTITETIEELEKQGADVSVLVYENDTLDSSHTSFRYNAQERKFEENVMMTSNKKGKEIERILEESLDEKNLLSEN